VIVQVKESRQAREEHKMRTADAVAESKELRARCQEQEEELRAAHAQLLQLRGQLCQTQRAGTKASARGGISRQLSTVSELESSSSRRSCRTGGNAPREALLQVTARVDSMQNAGATHTSRAAQRSGSQSARLPSSQASLRVDSQSTRSNRSGSLSRHVRGACAGHASGPLSTHSGGLNVDPGMPRRQSCT
jgi:seryl-tRNA synthetase